MKTIMFLSNYRIRIKNAFLDYIEWLLEDELYEFDDYLEGDEYYLELENDDELPFKITR